VEIFVTPLVPSKIIQLFLKVFERGKGGTRGITSFFDYVIIVVG